MKKSKGEVSQAGTGEDNLLTRRRLLAGSVGATVGGLLATKGILAQDQVQLAQAGPMTHATTAGSLSNRIYSLNPSHPDLADIAENPVNIPSPIARREPSVVRVDLETIEVEAPLNQTARFRFWTFNGKVPGPFIRVRVGDTVEVHL